MRGKSVLRQSVAVGLLFGYSAGFILLPEIHTHDATQRSTPVVRPLPQDGAVGRSGDLPFCAICFLLNSSQPFVSHDDHLAVGIPVVPFEHPLFAGLITQPHVSSVLGRAPPQQPS